MKHGIWQETDEGVMLFLNVKPGSSRNDVDSVTGNPGGEVSLSVRVRAQPEKGKANKAVISCLANTLGLPRSSISLIRGERGRRKTVVIKGNPADISHRLENITNHLNKTEGGNGRCKNN